MANWLSIGNKYRRSAQSAGLGLPSPAARRSILLLLAVIFSLIPLPVSATITFERNYDISETGGWCPGNFIQTIDKGYLTVTTSPEGSPNDPDYCLHLALIKFDSLGNLEWVYRHPQCNSKSSNFNFVTALANSADSHYFAGGSIFDTNCIFGPAFLTKVKSNGRASLWEYIHEPGRIPGDFDDVLGLPDGGCAAAGTFGTDSGIKAGLFRFNKDGALLWYRYYCPKPSNWEIDAGNPQVVPMPDGGYILGIHWYDDYDTLPEYRGMYVVRVDSIGNPIWTAQDTWPAQFSVEFWEAELTPKGNPAFFGIGGENLDSVCGVIKVYNSDNGEVILYKSVMTKRRPMPSEPAPSFFVRDGAVTPDGGFVLVGELTPDKRTKPCRVFLLRLNSDGDSIWCRTYGPENIPWAYGFAVVPTTDTGFCILGSQIRGRFVDYDPYIIKTDSLGVIPWVESNCSYQGGPNQRVGINEENRDLLAPSLSISPNPFTKSARIHYQLPSASQVLITAIDITGRTVATLFEGYQPAGNHQLRWHPEGLAQGIYFIKLQTPDFQLLHRTILLP